MLHADTQAVESDPAFRRGLYGLLELTRYLSFRYERRLAPSTVSRWMRHGITERQHRARRPDYSFADLVSMLVVRNLVALDFSLADIRDAEAYFRDRYGLQHPFVSVRLKTDRADIFYDAAPSVPGQLTAANRWGQEVLAQAITGALEGVAYEGGLAAEWMPVEGVVLDPTVQFGEPCVADTRVLTSQLAEMARETDAGPSELAELYRLDEIAVRRALAFEDELSRAA
jgi:uncharacterized protein (DUF433 family)